MKGHIRKSGNSYQLIYELPRGADGRRRQERRTVHGTKRDAEAKLREILTALDRGDHVTPTKETVGAFLERWLETYASIRTSLRTQRDYRGIVRRYLTPSLGDMVLATLRPADVQGLYSDLLARGLSAQTVLHTHRLLSEALSHAVKWGAVVRNVCAAVDPPRPEKKEMVALDTEGVDRLFASAEGSRYRDVFLIALYTGLRRPEVLGLRWDYVDVERRRLHIVAGLHFLTGMGLVLLPTKTTRSRRPVSFTTEVVDELRQVRGAQIVQKAELGPAWQDLGFVFTRPDGRPLDPAKVTNGFAEVMKRAGLPGVRLHDLRHTHASLMLQAGVHAKVVSERLGHASVGITLDTYSHVLPGVQEEAAETFSNFSDHAIDSDVAKMLPNQPSVA